MNVLLDHPAEKSTADPAKIFARTAKTLVEALNAVKARNKVCGAAGLWIIRLILARHLEIAKQELEYPLRASAD
jgi:hypothetical protein